MKSVWFLQSHTIFSFDLKSVCSNATHNRTDSEQLKQLHFDVTWSIKFQWGTCRVNSCERDIPIEWAFIESNWSHRHSIWLATTEPWGRCANILVVNNSGGSNLKWIITKWIHIGPKWCRTFWFFDELFNEKNVSTLEKSFKWKFEKMNRRKKKNDLKCYF